MEEVLRTALIKVRDDTPKQGTCIKAAEYAADTIKDMNLYGKPLKERVSLILNHITHWKGYQAQYVKDVLKRYAK